MRYACEYLVLSSTDQEKAVTELTQHVSETTSEVSEQDVGETTVNSVDLSLKVKEKFSKDKIIFLKKRRARKM